MFIYCALLKTGVCAGRVYLLCVLKRREICVCACRHVGKNCTLFAKREMKFTFCVFELVVCLVMS